MPQGRANDLCKSIAVLADDVYARLKASFPGSSQKSCPLGAMLGVFGIHGIQKKQVAQVKDTAGGSGEIKLTPIPLGVGAPAMEKGTAPAILLGHDVGVGGKGVIVYGNELRVDAVASTILEYVLAEGILAGIGGIVIFIPQIAFLFLFIS